MSAYVVDPRTVDLMLSVARDLDVMQALRGAYPFQDFAPLDSEDARDEARSMLGRYLLCMNVRSVQYCYRGEAVESLPGHVFDFLLGMQYHPMPDYTFRRVRVDTRDHGLSISAGAARRVLGAATCFDYQSCELPEWHGSPAWGFVVAVIRQCASALADGWEFTEEDAALGMVV